MVDEVHLGVWYCIVQYSRRGDLVKAYSRLLTVMKSTPLPHLLTIHEALFLFSMHPHRRYITRVYVDTYSNVGIGRHICMHR